MTWRPLFRLEPRLTLELCLRAGQCFNWHGWHGGKEFTGVLLRSVVSLRQDDDGDVHFCDHNAKERGDDDGSMLELQLRDVLRAEIAWEPLLNAWCERDPRIASARATLGGVRVLRQDPVECLFSFICSSNNNIPRITKMLDAIRVKYGDKLATVRGKDFHEFPAVDALAAAAEEDLRAMGCGYRAKFIVATARQLQACGGRPFLMALRREPRLHVREQLLQFAGVGPKVADCVALFSLEQHDVVPVDTHVWDIACRDFDRTLQKAKSLTPSVYERVGDLFRERYGAHAGWAHSLLFTAELGVFVGHHATAAARDTSTSAGTPSTVPSTSGTSTAGAATRKRPVVGGGAGAATAPVIARVAKRQK